MSVAANTLDAAKKHPFWLCGGVLVVIVLFQLKGSGSKASTTDAGITTLEEDPNQIAANTALQQTQAALNATTIQADDAVKANADTIAGQVAMAGIESTLYSNYFNTVSSVQNNQINAAQEVTDRQTNAEAAYATQTETDQNNLSQATLAAAVHSDDQQQAYGYADNIIATAKAVSDRYDPAYATGAFQNIISDTTGAAESVQYNTPNGNSTEIDTPGGSLNNILGLINGQLK